MPEKPVELLGESAGPAPVVAAKVRKPRASKPKALATEAQAPAEPSEKPKTKRAPRAKKAESAMTLLDLADVPAPALREPAPEPALTDKPVVIQILAPSTAAMVQPEPALHAEPAQTPVQAASEPAQPRYPRRGAPVEPVQRRVPQPISRPVSEPIRPAPQPPRAVDMAELADRQRQARDRARMGERDDRPAPRQAPPAPISMQERALRNRPLREEAAPRPQPSEDAPRPQHEHSDSLQRALEVSRHKRDSDEAPRPMVPMETAVGHGGVTVALVSRNHQGLVANALQQWRQVLGGTDVRWALLDLGSTDDSVAEVEDFPGIRLVLRPGGLVEPAATLQAALQQLTGDTLAVVDVQALPDPLLAEMIRQVQGGAALVVAPQQRPAMLAVSRTTWEKTGSQVPNWQAWAEQHGGLRRLGSAHGPELSASLVAALFPAQKPRRRDKLLGLLPAALRVRLRLWRSFFPKF